MIEELKINLITDEVITSHNTGLKRLSYESYKEYLIDNKYKLFYMTYKIYTDHVKNCNFNKRTHDTILFKTPLQDIYLNTSIDIDTFYQDWFNAEIKKINIIIK